MATTTKWLKWPLAIYSSPIRRLLPSFESRHTHNTNTGPWGGVHASSVAPPQHHASSKTPTPDSLKQSRGLVSVMKKICKQSTTVLWLRWDDWFMVLVLSVLIMNDCSFRGLFHATVEVPCLKWVILVMYWWQEAASSRGFVCEKYLGVFWSN